MKKLNRKVKNYEKTEQIVCLKNFLYKTRVCVLVYVCMRTLPETYEKTEP